MVKMNLFVGIILIIIHIVSIHGYISFKNNNNIKIVINKRNQYKLPTIKNAYDNNANHPFDKKKSTILASLGILLFNYFVIPTKEVYAKTEYPSLEKCFNAIESELSTNGESLQRINKDIENLNWDDLKLFTREYDAGFRNGVLKPIWKQLTDDDQKRGIEISNSFTFDLIALNKAARNQDIHDAKNRVIQVKQDLEDYMKLKKF